MGTCFCWRDGRIEFGRRSPRNALPLATGPLRRLRGIVCAKARHAYDGSTLLVPGVPEAETDTDALSAAVDFSKRLKSALNVPLAGGAL